MYTNKLSIIGVVLLLLIGGGLYYFIAVYNPKPADGAIVQKGAENVAQASKDNTPSKTTSKNSNSDDSAAVRPTATSQLQGTAIGITEFSQSKGVVHASATVNNVDVGTCYYGFSSVDTKPVSRVNQSQPKSGKQICSVEIPEVEFTKLGVWQMLLSFTQNGAKVEANQDVAIN